jgi:DNA-binding GntR family transcriptional regulator
MRYRTKEDFVADYLREAIISGRFERGQRLKQAEIAAHLSLSITPVREAMKLLEAEGYVTRESHHGAQVSAFDIDTSDDVVGLRVLLEERLVRAAILRLTDGDIAELNALEDEFESAISSGDRMLMRGINYRFHRHLYELAQQPQTLHFVQVLWAKYPFDVINTLQGRAQRAGLEHRQLLTYLVSGDVDSAAQAVRAHIEEGWAELREHLRSDSAQQTPSGARNP